MKPQIESIVRRFAGGSASVHIAKGGGAEFEMWLLLTIADFFQKAPWNAQLHDKDDLPIGPGGLFILRGAPGLLGRGPACHVAILWNGEIHEFHANIQIRGRSTETHEIDICLVPKVVADQLRLIGGGRLTGQPRIAIECKFKEKIGSKDEARQVVARQFDLSFLYAHPVPWLRTKPTIWAESNPQQGHGVARTTYMQSFGHCFNGLCRLGGVTVPCGTYLAFNRVNPYRNLKPGFAETNAFLNDLEAYLTSRNP